jgi:hypothetical protein
MSASGARRHRRQDPARHVTCDPPLRVGARARRPGSAQSPFPLLPRVPCQPEARPSCSGWTRSASRPAPRRPQLPPCYGARTWMELTGKCGVIILIVHGKLREKIALHLCDSHPFATEN